MYCSFEVASLPLALVLFASLNWGCAIYGNKLFMPKNVYQILVNPFKNRQKGGQTFSLC